ncbi:hypothetical protein EM595_p1091 (plasmid) [Duffyella gerundensis]|uniref:Uncharacterized protein n=3 Tax=Duffyella gerundensis TaxID=1619313 RepID=A0A0U5GU89_9GAMM|nr:hypothetical protein EM595_p1091 [Duffyella gerundensis]
MLRITTSNMQDHKILASAALFRKLHDNRIDIYDVLTKFITSTININSMWVFNVSECVNKLEEDFGFNIPEAIVETCLRKRMKRHQLLTQMEGKYHVTDKFDKSDSLGASYREIQDEQDFIIGRLTDYIQSRSGKVLSEQLRNELASDFHLYFTGALKDCDNKIAISEFIIKNSDDESFTRKINSVEEGFIIYTAICHSSDLANPEPWCNNFTIFLDTEILFDALGLNGTLRKKIFDELYGLITDANYNTPKGVRITLKYFQETFKEFEGFFYAAQKTIEEGRQPHLAKPAMAAIINGCHYPTDVLFKKVTFIEELKKLKITVEEDADYYSDPRYIVEGTSEVSYIRAKYPELDEENVTNTLEIFTKINHLRRGVNNRGLEQSGCIFLTGTNATKKISYLLATKSGGNLTPYASATDYMTERLWFKLSKGFGGRKKTPLSFNVVAKAQVILSTEAGNKIADSFKDLQKKVKQGSLSMESAGVIVSELRSKLYMPEDFTSEIIGESTQFLHNDFIEDSIRNITLLTFKAKEAEAGKNTIQALQHQLDASAKVNEALEKKLSEKKQETLEKIQKNRNSQIDTRKKSLWLYKFFAKTEFLVSSFIIYTLPLCVLAAAIISFNRPGDTLLGNVSFIVGVIPMVSYLKLRQIQSYVLRKIRSRYRNRISKKYNLFPLTPFEYY